MPMACIGASSLRVLQFSPSTTGLLPTSKYYTDGVHHNKACTRNPSANAVAARRWRSRRRRRKKKRKDQQGPGRSASIASTASPSRASLPAFRNPPVESVPPVDSAASTRVLVRSLSSIDPLPPTIEQQQPMAAPSKSVYYLRTIFSSPAAPPRANRRLLDRRSCWASRPRNAPIFFDRRCGHLGGQDVADREKGSFFLYCDLCEYISHGQGAHSHRRCMSTRPSSHAHPAHTYAARVQVGDSASHARY